MENFIYDNFINPIWDRTGYNIVNTLVYSIIALIAIFFLHKILKKYIVFDEKFIFGVLTFVLFGSTLRVVTDSIDNGVFSPITPIHDFILKTHIYDYGYLTVTPGIYLLTSFILLLTLFILNKIKKEDLLPYVGGFLWLIHFLLLIPFMNYALYAIPILLLTLFPSLLCWLYFKDNVSTLVVFGQALDGAATFFIIDYFSKIIGKEYFEQHVISAGIGAIGGSFFFFYLIKIIISILATYELNKSKIDQNDRNFIALIFMIMGFAPGIRDVLRMMLGT